MTTQTVSVCLASKLPCCVPGAEVILCLPTSAIKAPQLCPETDDQFKDFGELGFIGATVVTCSPVSDNCGGISQWLYQFNYNDEDLADPEVLLTAVQITGAFCEDCLVSYVSAAIGNEVYIEIDGEGIVTLVSQHGCRYIIPGGGGGEGGLPLLVQDSNSVDLEIAGSPQQTLTANVKISATAGNEITLNADGIYAPAAPAATPPLLVTDTSSLDLTISGSPQQTLSGIVKISVDAGNQLVLHADGLYIAATSPPPPLSEGTSTERTTTQIANPAMGLQTVNQALIAFNAAGSNPNNYPSQSVIYRAQWVELEPTEGAYNFSTILTFLDKALASNQKVNLRVYENDPGSGFGPPVYLYNYAGWKATQDDGGATVFSYPYWGNASVKNAHANFLNAMFTAISTHPALGTLDCGWGVYNENTYSGTHYNGTSNGSVPVVGVGSELPNLAVADYQAFYDRFNYSGIIKVAFPDHQGSFNYAVGVLGFGVRADGWGFRSNPVSCPAAGVQMCTLYPNTFVPAGTFPNSWQSNRTALECWSSINSWVSNGWDYNSSMLWAWQTAHASEINVKGNFSPTGGLKTALEALMLKAGFRYVLRSISHYANVTAGASVTINMVWENVGTAPNYKPEVVLIRLVNPISGQVFKVYTALTTKWLPGGTLARSADVALPTWLNAATFNVYVGIGLYTAVSPDIELAINGDDGRFWYSLGTTMAVTNAAPTTPPTTDWAATFLGSSSQRYTSTNVSFRMNGTDWSLACKAKVTSLAATQTIVAKGTSAAGTQEYRLWFDTGSQRFKASFSNGATVYTATANTFGAPLINTFYSLIVTFNNTSKTLTLYVNTIGDSVVGTGNIPAGSNEYTVGSDAGGANYLTGQITDLASWLVIVSGAQRTAYHNAGLPISYAETTNVLKFGMFYYFSMNGVAGSILDDRRNIALTDMNGVTKTALN